MPRLSIIIPHRNDQLLEETILSVLENRPRDCEIIIAHDGSYCDPYSLVDEVVYVQEEPKSNVVDLLNAGLMAACSPVVCVLLDGVVVSANWAEAAVKRFARTEVASVAPQLQIGRSLMHGISAEALHNVSNLRSGRVESKASSAVAAPTLAAGFYRRKVLRAVGGWNDEVGSASADVELAMLMSELKMTCECEPQVVFRAAAEAIPRRTSKQAVSELAGIAAAHGIAAASIGSTLSSVIAAAFTGTVSNALAWSSGLSNKAVTRESVERLTHASKTLGASQEAASVKIYSETESAQRRKAA